MYKDLLSATCEVETEWTGSKVSVRVKSVNVIECREEGMADLKSKIDSLTAILKSSNFGTSKPQGKEKWVKEKQHRKADKGRVNPPLILH